MTNHTERGNNTGGASDEKERNGTFKKGHKKQGGRKQGTPNAVTWQLKAAIIEAANRVGNDGKGTDGLVGYFKSMAVDHPAAFCRLLGKLMVAEHRAELAGPRAPQGSPRVH